MLTIAACTTLLFACASGGTLTIERETQTQDGSKIIDRIKVEIPKAPEDGGGGTTNRDVKEQNGNKGASDIYLDVSESNVALSSDQIPKIILTLTLDGFPKYSRVFDGVIVGEKIKFADSVAVDSWSEQYLDDTDGATLNLSVIHERKLGLNTRVYKFYAAGAQIAANADSEWVTSLSRVNDDIGQE